MLIVKNYLQLKDGIRCWSYACQELLGHKVVLAEVSSSRAYTCKHYKIETSTTLCPQFKLFDRSFHDSSLRGSTSRNCNWDDSDWMKHDDENTEAYEQLDITKLKPFPEYRNVAAGPVWGAGAFDLVWKKYYEEQAPAALIKKQNLEWEEYVHENEISPEEYFSTEEFQERYGDLLIWQSYIRNHKGSRPRQRTRLHCFRKGVLYSHNPCPLCRDPKILINYKNTRLLNNFIDPLSGEVHHSLRTGVCRIKQQILEKVIWLSRDFGYLPKPVATPLPHNLDAYKVDHPAVQAINK